MLPSLKVASSACRPSAAVAVAEIAAASEIAVPQEKFPSPSRTTPAETSCMRWRTRRFFPCDKFLSTVARTSGCSASDVPWDGLGSLPCRPNKLNYKTIL